MSWSTSLLRMKPPCVVKPLHLCSPKAPRSRKRRRDSCFHNLNGYAASRKEDLSALDSPDHIPLVFTLNSPGLCTDRGSISKWYIEMLKRYLAPNSLCSMR